MSGSFLDSNVLLYLLSADERKRQIARALLNDDVTISVQVLNEIANVARGKYRLPWDRIEGFIDDLLPLVVVNPLTLQLHQQGRMIAARYGYAIYDSLILAAAIAAGCSTLFSEDMHDGHRIGELRIVNPFAQPG